MKILHTVAPAEFGGLEQIVLCLSRGLRERRHEVSVACVLDTAAGSSPLVEALEGEGVAVWAVVVAPRAYLREIAEIRRLCETIGPAVVHTHGYRPCVLHSRGVRPLGIPLVTTLHGFTGGGLKNRIYERLQVRSLSHFDAVVAVSGALASTLRRRGVREDTLHVIQNAWCPGREAEVRSVARDMLGVPAGDFHVGWVGRLSSEKGPDTFLDAMARLPTGGGVTVSIVGDGPLRKALEERAARVSNVHVRFHGAVRDAGRLFAGFDAFVLSSRTEGTPIVLFEAMAASVPIVATAVGGVPDVVSPESAILVSPEDPEALVRAIAEVREDRSAAEHRAARARIVLDERFSEGPWLDEYEDLYESIRRS